VLAAEEVPLVLPSSAVLGFPRLPKQAAELCCCSNPRCPSGFATRLPASTVVKTKAGLWPLATMTRKTLLYEHRANFVLEVLARRGFVRSRQWHSA